MPPSASHWWAGRRSLGAGDRDDNGIVEIHAEELSLRFHHANDSKPVTADLDTFAKRIAGAEQLLFRLRPENRQRATAPFGFVRFGGSSKSSRPACER